MNTKPGMAIGRQTLRNTNRQPKLKPTRLQPKVTPRKRRGLFSIYVQPDRTFYRALRNVKSDLPYRITPSRQERLFAWSVDYDRMTLTRTHVEFKALKFEEQRCGSGWQQKVWEPFHFAGYRPVVRAIKASMDDFTHLYPHNYIHTT